MMACLPVSDPDSKRKEIAISAPKGTKHIKAGAAICFTRMKMITSLQRRKEGKEATTKKKDACVCVCVHEYL